MTHIQICLGRMRVNEGQALENRFAWPKKEMYMQESEAWFE
jgi:hypothetical protein